MVPTGETHVWKLEYGTTKVKEQLRTPLGQEDNTQQAIGRQVVLHSREPHSTLVRFICETCVCAGLYVKAETMLRNRKEYSKIQDLENHYIFQHRSHNHSSPFGQRLTHPTHKAGTNMIRLKLR
jgi:hypothetical protein